MTDRHLRAIPDDDANPSMPHDDDAERQALGAMLTGDRWALDAVTTILTGADYYQPRHELIHDACVHLYARGTTPEPTAVITRLRDTKNLARAGGPAYIHEIYQGLVTAANADYHADSVHALATRRRALAALDAAKARLLTPSDDHSPHLLDRLRADLDGIPLRPPGVDETTTAHPWAPVDLAHLRANGLERPRPTTLTLGTGEALLYPGRTHSISGESTTGKTWITLAGLCQAVANKQPVTFIDFEDRADTLLTRLHDMGANPNDVDRLVRYIGPDRAMDAAAWTHVETATKDVELVVIDGVTEAMTMHGWSLLDNEDIARWYDALPRRIATLGPAVIEIDHVVKDKEARGRYAIGGAHKLNGITGCAYTCLAVKPFAVGQPGSSRITVAKDRHGAIGPVGHTAAEFHVTPDPTRHKQAMVWELTPNQATYTAAGRPRLTGYMEKVSRYLETNAGTNKRGIYDSIRGKETHLAAAIDTLLDEGWIRTEPGARGATFHYVVKPYREGEDDHA